MRANRRGPNPMAEIKFTSDITVHLVQQMGGDHMVVAAARVSTTGAEALQCASLPADEQAGLIRYLMKHRHGTPFEHSAMTFFLHAPAFVWWEWVRHRIGQTVDCSELSFNLESGRYRELQPVFWVPRRDRAMRVPEKHSPARPRYEEMPEDDYTAACGSMARAYLSSWDEYQRLLAIRVAPEVARAVLGFGVYYSGWVTCNPRSLMSFLSLRTYDLAAKYVSYPQAEIEEAARACEECLKIGWPITHAAFVECGRVAP